MIQSHRSIGKPETRRGRDNCILGSEIGKIAQGDGAALERVHALTRETVMAAATALVGDRTLADDVASEVYVSIWRQAGTFDSRRGSARRWLAVLTRSRAIDVMRRIRADERRRPTSEVPVDTVAADEAPAVASDTRSLVQSAVDRLPAKQREVIRFAYLEGLSQRDVARRLGVPLGTVKTRARLAIDRLRNALAGHRESALIA